MDEENPENRENFIRGKESPTMKRSKSKDDLKLTDL